MNIKLELLLKYFLFNFNQNDWQKDSQGQDTLTYTGYYDGFFELADIWCLDIDGDEYANFLNTLQKRITVKKITRADGSVVRVLVFYILFISLLLNQLK